MRRNLTQDKLALSAEFNRKHLHIKSSIHLNAFPLRDFIDFITYAIKITFVSSTLPPADPVGTMRPLVFSNARLVHLNTVPLQRIRRDVIATLGVDRTRCDEVFVEVIDEFQYIAFHGPRNRDMIDQAAWRFLD